MEQLVVEGKQRINEQKRMINQFKHPFIEAKDRINDIDLTPEEPEA